MSFAVFKPLEHFLSCLDGEYSGCGGSLVGLGGRLSGEYDVGCDWLITVDDGFIVQLDFEQFQVRLLFLR